MTIKEHIINNFKGDDYKALKAAIDESIESNDEITLPGLGVFFELVWKSADQELKNNLVEIIRQSIQKGLTDNS